MFGKDFVWGAASSSYQTEGAWEEDGKGRSIWDDFCHEKGHIIGEETGDVACDSYHHLEEDVSLMKETGIKAYRFSISWPRLFPKGDMALNQKGLDYYDRFVDLLLSEGIEPYITLYHWDLPSELQAVGGWQNRETAYAFADYAEFTAKHFGDRVKHFITLNEPQIFTMLGYKTGVHAPGLRLTTENAMQCTHHALLAHGLAVEKIRGAVPTATIGIASTGRLCYPLTKTRENIEAALKESFQFRNLDSTWMFTHTWFMDPICFGKYPVVSEEGYTKFIQSVPDSDMKVISGSIDFLGVNIYNGTAVDEDGQPVRRIPGSPRTALKWSVTPQVMHYGIRALYERYQLPILITENGQACNDRIFLDGKIHDPDRIDFLKRYLLELKKAQEDGVKLLGYFHWSFLDNFEWHNGYDDRFGLVYVDYQTGRRTRKDSAYWYKKVIETNGSLE